MIEVYYDRSVLPQNPLDNTVLFDGVMIHRILLLKQNE